MQTCLRKNYIIPINIHQLLENDLGINRTAGIILFLKRNDKTFKVTSAGSIDLALL